MLKIQNLSANVLREGEKKELVKNISMTLKSGSITLLVGANGAGKSTIARAVMGHPEVELLSSSKIIFKGKEIQRLSIDERAKLGIFVSFQNPVAIPGVKILDFLKEAYNVKHDPKDRLDIWGFIDLFEKESINVGLPTDISDRDINVGFSGGEMKKLELLQMLILQPKIVILDEIDSGVDVDTVKKMYKIINKYVKDFKAGVLVISHNPAVLKTLDISSVYLLKEGVITEQGDIKLAKKIFERGFEEE